MKTNRQALCAAALTRVETLDETLYLLTSSRACQQYEFGDNLITLNDGTVWIDGMSLNGRMTDAPDQHAILAGLRYFSDCLQTMIDLAVETTEANESWAASLSA